ncbi:Oligopeptide/dipeptide ABC transporter, periplasmic substrate-binding protein [Roseibacterium elongatum DSM 19469]|uniref:Oligopeptide/dipeptide ABC transporter, periplasmic substrate-binding protein n=1 Tax=Roseicyclus elongatus DSM 19469 TaxID=1294273 RepID=W8SR50_9RHOB|nr:ABC transporter substrate-binding protein [Roseibacterium elongatum]AHM04990.1 Oligopeptide/dipeptide ABC transporter, periplasmic substrate-binding protein [Roseibacterium elongatum DSM 19469]
MTKTQTQGLASHPVAEMYAREYKDGKLSRREFLVRSTALGVTAAAAYSMIGATPAAAETMRATPPMGGSLRIQMEVRALKDPRTYDWSQMANVSRGILEYLIEYNADGSFSGVLLDSWEANEDATQYTLRLREGVKWNNGDDFTAEDVAANFIGWCDSTVEGNSMAARMGGLVDPDTGVARDGAIEVVDPLTVRINYPAPDITLVPGIADYPSAVQHRDLIGTNPLDHGVGTGAYRITDYEVGVQARLEKNPDHDYWGEAYLDEVIFVDLGQDPAAWFAAAEADEFDMTYETVGEFVDLFAAIGWTQSEVTTAATVVIRPNQNTAPYDNPMVRKAIQLAVDPQVCLDLGINGQGTLGEHHHVCPIHPEYAELPPLTVDPDAANAMLQESGHADHVFEIVSIDDDYRRNTTDAVAAQLRDAGFNVERTVIPGSTFWNDWTTYPFSSTNWNHRELGVIIHNLAYRSGVAWNEFGYSNPEFDALLDQANGILDAEARSEVMAQLESILQEDAVTLQPYWRSLFRHHKAEVINADMHPKFEINVHYLGVEA